METNGYGRLRDLIAHLFPPYFPTH